MKSGSERPQRGPYLPLANIWYIISGRTHDANHQCVVPEQRLTRAQALRAASANCASLILQDGRVGSLEPGKHAEPIVLSSDYFPVPVDDIKFLTLVLTIVRRGSVYGAVALEG